MPDIVEVFGNADVLAPLGLAPEGESVGAPAVSPSDLGDLPAKCPVIPLGKLGDVFYYLDETEELREVKARDHSRLNILSLFGKKNYLLHEFWPRFDKEGKKSGWKPEIAAEALIAEASRRGAWSPFARVRGPGGWSGEDNELIFHCGDRIITKYLNGSTRCDSPGLLDKLVYPRGPDVMPPDDKPAPGCGRGPADDLLTLFRTWMWARADVDPVLLLGWVGAAILGGALKWRPVCWLTGGQGTGKSTLQDVVENLLGKHGLVHSVDTTAAGIWQTIGYASLPVVIDENEPEENNQTKMNALVKLARVACSGGLVLRGGSDHTGAQFTARSAFLFSSILLPSLLPQDRSRMAILELKPLSGSTVPDMTPRTIADIGCKLRRRLMDGWPRFTQTLELYRGCLGAVGHKARGADVFGTLLACADLLLFDDIPDSDSLDIWAGRLRADTLAELDGSDGDEWSCLQWLLSSAFDSYRGGARLPVGEWIKIAMEDNPYETKENAKKALGNIGLRIDQRDDSWWLLVANAHRGLASIFDRSQWAARSGAQGVWVQSLRRLPGAEVMRNPDVVAIGGVRTRATKIPLSLVFVPETAPGVKPGV